MPAHQKLSSQEHTDIFVLLPREWIQGIKRMTTMYFTHGLFLTCTEKSHLYLYNTQII
jgi:hypothetical protein